MERNGKPVVVQRVNGQAPRAGLVSATVPAIVTGYAIDTEVVSRTGYSDRETGSISQGDRSVLVMERDLRAARFPLPLRKNDRIILDAGAGDMLNVVDVDAETRHVAGAIEMKAAGVG